VTPDSDKTASDDLVLEVDGPDVHIDTLDARGVLRLAFAYFDLLERLANDREEELSFIGLRAFEKCGSLATRPSDIEVARLVTLEATAILSSWMPAPYGLRQSLSEVRAARSALPPHYSATVKVSGISRQIAAAPSEVITRRAFATTSMRAEVIKIGGRTPRAVFKSKSEHRQFTLTLADTAQATALGHYLYSKVDIVARVARGFDGMIESGDLREFFPVSKNTQQVWSEWYANNGRWREAEVPTDDDGDGS
jgi:hypothetical protein